MIIRDINGQKLELTKTRLLESYGSHDMPRYLELADLRASHKNKSPEVKITRIELLGVNDTMDIAYAPKMRVIGCRTFSPATFAKILKAAGVRKTNKVARKKGKK